MVKKQKIQSFLIGFLGWFISGNLIFWAFFWLPMGRWLDVIRVYGFGVITVIITGFLFYNNRKSWYALGIMSAMIINGIAWKIYLDEKPIFSFTEVFAVPLPVGLYNLIRTAFGPPF